MLFASIIIGALFIICGIYCITAPIGTYAIVMTMFAAMLFVYGIFGIIRYIKQEAVVQELIVAIASLIIGFVNLFRPGLSLGMLDSVVLFLVSAWFLCKGCVNVYFSYQTREVNPRWIIGMISGLLSVFLGVYSLIFPAVAAESIGIIVGLWYVQCGIELISFGTVTSFVKARVKEVKDEADLKIEEARKAVREYADELKARAEQAPANSEEVKNIPITDGPVNSSETKPELVEVVDEKTEKTE